MATEFKKQLYTPKKKAVNILATFLSVLFFPGLSVAQTSTIDTLTGWISGELGPWGSYGPTGTVDIGQTIVPTADQTNLTSFTFSLRYDETQNNITPGLTVQAPQFVAKVYEWNSTTLPATALFTSSTITAPSRIDAANFTNVTVNTGGLQLVPGQKYLLLFAPSKDIPAINAYTFKAYSTTTAITKPYAPGDVIVTFSDNTSFNYGGNFNLAFLAEFGPLIPVGPSAADTQSSLELSAQRLKGIYNLQSGAVVNGLSYDCKVFNVNNICLSTGGRYSNNHGASGYTTSALLIGAYRLNKNVRIGAWVDQNLSANTTTSVNLGNSEPLFGVFGVWAENPTGEGYEVKISAGYGNKDLTVTRDVLGTSQAGMGKSRLNSQAISSVSSYGFRINNEMLASPYVGIRYNRIASNGYTEATSTDVTAPLTYNKLTQENLALMAGVRLSAKLDPKTTFVASAGFEQNLKNRSGQYSATGVDGLTPIEFNSNPQKTRATASVGAYYDIDKTQRLSVNGIYREEAFSPTATTSVLATYTVGF